MRRGGGSGMPSLGDVDSSPTGYRLHSIPELLLAVRQGSKPQAETLLSG
jgi:hypothetical protein